MKLAALFVRRYVNACVNASTSVSAARSGVAVCSRLTHFVADDETRDVDPTHCRMALEWPDTRAILCAKKVAGMSGAKKKVAGMSAWSVRTGRHDMARRHCYGGSACSEWSQSLGFYSGWLAAPRPSHWNPPPFNPFLARPYLLPRPSNQYRRIHQRGCQFHRASKFQKLRSRCARCRRSAPDAQYD